MPIDPTPQVLELAQRFRAQLLARERRAAGAMVRYYGVTWQRLQPQIQALSAEAAAMTLAGQEIGPGAIWRLERMKAIQAQAAAEAVRFAEFADITVTTGQREALVAGQRNAHDLILGSFPADAGIQVSFAAMPAEAVETMVGFLADGSPLHRLLVEAVGASVDDFAQTMVTGLAAGWNPRRLAGQLRSSFGMGLTRALSIARTEQLRAYRTATLNSYQQSDIVTGWERLATHDERTCFPAGVEITTLRGWIPIEQVQIGDLVLTHGDRYRRVTGTMRRVYSGKMVTLSAGDARLTCTATHPILVRRSGEDYWIAAEHCETGDTIFVHNDQCADEFEHPWGGLPIEGSVGNADDLESIGEQPPGLAQVGARAGRVPVDTIDLQCNVRIRQMEVNGVPINSGLLLKSDTEFSQAQPHIPLGFSLASMAAVANHGTKLLIGHCRHNAKLFAALLASVYHGWAATQLRAVASIWGTAKRFTAALANMINVRGGRFFASNTAKVVAVSGRLGHSVDLLAFGARFRHAAVGAIAGAGTEFALPTTMAQEFDTAIQTDAFDLPILKRAIAFAATEKMSLSPLDPGPMGLVLLSTVDANEINHCGLASKVDNLSHSIAQNIVVYNLEIEHDHTFFANDILVHNCMACIMLDGKRYRKNEPMDDHPQGRCAMMPITKSYREMGIDAAEPDFRREMGEDWFLRQNEGVQRTMMGSGVFEGWKAGEFKLTDIPVLRRDDVWGNSWVPSPLGDLIGD